MKKFILSTLIFAFLILSGWGCFKLVSSASTPHIVNNHTFEYQTYSLFKIENGVLRINHKTGETHYLSQGMFVPITALTSEQLQEIMSNPYQRPQSQNQKMLQNLD